MQKFKFVTDRTELFENASKKQHRQNNGHQRYVSEQ